MVYNGIGLLRRCDSGLVTTEESRSQWAGTASSRLRDSRQQSRTHIYFISTTTTTTQQSSIFTTGRAASPSGLSIFPSVSPTGPGDQLLSGAAHCSLLTLQVQHFLGDSNILLTSTFGINNLRLSLTKHPVHGTFLDFSKTHFPGRRIEFLWCFYGTFSNLDRV